MAEDTEPDEVRDVTDLSTNAEVEEEVDEMLEIPEEERPERDLDDDEEEVRPEIKEAMEEAERRKGEDGETRVTVDSEDEEPPTDDFDFEDQDWDKLDKEPEIKSVAGLRFKFAEPENDDQVLNDLERHADGGTSDQMRGMISMVVEAPELTDERWGKLPITAKLQLANEAAEYLGLGEDFLDEFEGGQTVQQAR